MFNFLICVAVYLSLIFISVAITDAINLYNQHCNNKSYEHCYQKAIKKAEGITIIENRDDLWTSISK